MRTLTLLFGTVSHASVVSSTAGSVSTSDDGYVRGNVSTFHTTIFRVDGKPVRFEQAMNLANRDAVTLVGYDKAEFEPLVLRNDSTGVIYRKGGGCARSSPLRLWVP
jgi:hypothetical protein